MFLNEKNILVTGACGTIGKELARQLLEEYQVGELVALDNNKSELFFLENRFSKPSQASFFLALDETRRAWELTNYFVVLPAFTRLYQSINYSYSDVVSKTITKPYHSEIETKLSKDQLSEFLKKNNLLESEHF